MKTKLTSTALALISIALLASCEPKEHKALEIDIPINTESSVKPADIFAPADGASVIENKDGVFMLTKAAEGKAVLETDPVPGEIYEFPETELKLDAKDIPANAKGKNPGILLTITNPRGEPILLSGTITVGDTSVPMPEIVVTREKETVFMTNDQNLPAPGYDDIVTLPSELKGRITDGFSIHKLSLIKYKSTSASSIKQMAAGQNNVKTFTVTAEFTSPMCYEKGTVLHIERKFSDLGINIEEYLNGLTTKDFRISVVVTSSIPFDITGTIKSEDGMSGELDNVIKAGTKDKPVSTEAILSVTRESKDITLLQNAFIAADLTAGENAVLQAGQTLKVDISKLTLLIK